MIVEELYIYSKGGYPDYTIDANYKGDWDNATEYIVNDIVIFEDSYYKALTTTTGDEPAFSFSVWELLPDIFDPNLIVNYTQIDLKDTAIIRRYQTPYFSDVKKVFADTTYSITLPPTEKNKSALKYLHEADMNTDFPYTYHYADYFIEGMQIIKEGRINILGDFEIQIVYGLSFSKYLEFTSKKCNEYNVFTDLNWNKTTVDSNSKFIDYISGIRNRDAEIISGVTQPPVSPPEPILSNQKQMTQHVFLTFNEILSEIETEITGETKIYDKINTLLTNKGILLNGNSSDVFSNSKTYTPTYQTAGSPSTNYGLKLNGTDADYILSNESPVSATYPSKIRIDSLVFGDIYPCKVKVKLNSIKIDQFYYNVNIHKNDGTVISNNYITGTNNGDGTWTFNNELTLELDNGQYIALETSADGSILTGAVLAGTVSFTTYLYKNFYNCVSASRTTAVGNYNINRNLPNILVVEFIQQILIHLCGFLGNDNNNNIQCYLLSDFKDNYDNGIVYDWSGRISNTKKSYYQFNSNSQKNYIKFSNDKDLTDRFESVDVNDLTLQAQRDLYVLDFESPLGLEGEKSEYILYEQNVKKTDGGGITFENKYNGDSKNHAFVYNNSGIAQNINIIGNNYDIYQKLIERPIVKEVDVLLDFYESANIDYTKPIYIEEWGKYCMLLELTAPNNGFCQAKLLLINQPL